MHPYRTHHCNQLTAANVGESVKLSGWVHRKRDHGQLLFVDLRDHFGLTQLVMEEGSDAFKLLEHARNESVLTVTGKVVKRTEETVNKNLPTGEVEVVVETCIVESTAEQLPLQVNSDADTGEDIRLKYRFLDLRREKIHSNIMLRANVISSIRRRMTELGIG